MKKVNLIIGLGVDIKIISYQKFDHIFSDTGSCQLNVKNEPCFIGNSMDP